MTKSDEKKRAGLSGKADRAAKTTKADKAAKAAKGAQPGKDAKADKAGKAKAKATRKAEKRALKKEAAEQAKAGRAIRKATDRALRDLVRQTTVEATDTAARSAVRTAQQAVKRLSPRYEAPHPVSGRSVVGSWDLHMHSVFSNGSRTVDELIAEARTAGITRIAITDHDSLARLSYVRERAHELSFPVLAGVEVSARDMATGRKVHILGFGLSATEDGSGPVERLVAPTLTARTANTLWQAWVLQRQGIEFSGKYLSLDELVATAGESTGVYKQHVMETLTHRSYTDPDYQFCYACWFKGESPANRDIPYPPAIDAVRAIREQGGVPVLAHPGQTDSWTLVSDLVGAGLLGIEAYHPDHSERDRELAFELAGTLRPLRDGRQRLPRKIRRGTERGHVLRVSRGSGRAGGGSVRHGGLAQMIKSRQAGFYHFAAHAQRGGVAPSGVAPRTDSAPRRAPRRARCPACPSPSA